MSMIAIRVSDKEKLLIEKFASFEGLPTSSYLKKLFYEKLEDYEDMKAIEEYENSEEYNNPGKSFSEFVKELGLDNEV